MPKTKPFKPDPELVCRDSCGLPGSWFPHVHTQLAWHHCGGSAMLLEATPTLMLIVQGWTTRGKDGLSGRGWGVIVEQHSGP